MLDSFAYGLSGGGFGYSVALLDKAIMLFCSILLLVSEPLSTFAPLTLVRSFFNEVSPRTYDGLMTSVTVGGPPSSLETSTSMRFLYLPTILCRTLSQIPRPFAPISTPF